MKSWLRVGTSSTFFGRGFTIVELLVVVVVIAILASVTVIAFNGITARANSTRAMADLNNIAKAMATYKVLNGALPIDTSLGVPVEISSHMRNGDTTPMINADAWPGSYYDYEVWDLDYDGADETYQISIRFCRDNNGNPQGEDGPNCKFPATDWAADFVPESSVYYCLEGYCRSHKWIGGIHTPGYCVNCSENKAVAKPGET